MILSGLRRLHQQVIGRSALALPHPNMLCALERETAVLQHIADAAHNGRERGMRRIRPNATGEIERPFLAASVHC